MSKVVLLLNVVVLLVTFAVAWGATDSQIGILDSTVRAGTRVSSRHGPADSAVSYLRVIQSLENILPPDRAKTLDASHMRAIRDALESYSLAVGTGVSEALASEGDAESIRRALANLGREARLSVETSLERSLGDRQLASYVATAIITNAR